MTARKRDGRRGAALVEFALMALLLYLLVAGGVELGRMVFISQVLQDAARIAARELSVTPLPVLDPDDNTQGLTFDAALQQSNVKTQIWNPDFLVIDLDDLDAHGVSIDDYFGLLPLVNRALRPAFIADTITLPDKSQHRLFRYPGALVTLQNPATPLGYGGNATVYTVAIPRVVSRDSTGVEDTIQWIPVVEEVRSNDPTNSTVCAPYGPFNLIPPAGAAPPGCVAPATSGIVEVKINYPFQAAALSGFRSAGFETDPPNQGVAKANLSELYVIPADDATKAILNPANAPQPAIDAATNTPYGGQYGLGSQYAFAKTVGNGTVRPYRSLLLGQAIFRREVIQ